MHKISLTKQTANQIKENMSTYANVSQYKYVASQRFPKTNQQKNRWMEKKIQFYVNNVMYSHL